MAKELPYFKFYVSEWSDGDITLENLKTQGLFINICSYYWSNNCKVSLGKMKKKFKTNSKLIDYLVKEKIIKLDSNENLIIKFLDLQHDEYSRLSNQNSINALKRWEKKTNESERNASALDSQSENNAIKIKEDNNKIIKENSIEQRKADFRKSLHPFSDEYGLLMLQDFSDYWTEHGEKDRKMRFEKENSFGISRRLSTWKKRQIQFNITNTDGTKKNRRERFIGTYKG